MNKTILVGLAILTVSTSAASAWTHPTHHSRAMKPNASAVVMKPNTSTRTMNANAFAGAPPAAMPGVSSKDHETRMKNLHDSGYNPKNDFNANGILKQQ